jgi:hypothetical protein
MQKREMQIIKFLHLQDQEIQFTQIQILHYYMQKRETQIIKFHNL